MSLSSLLFQVHWTKRVVPPQPLDINRQPAYIMKDFLRSRRSDGNFKYLVDWEGSGPEKQSWVPSMRLGMGLGHQSEPYESHT